MRIPSSLSVIALALTASLACGCFKTTTSTERVPGTAQRHLLAPKDREPVLQGAFRLGSNAVEGTLSWSRSCRVEEQRSIDVQKVSVRKTDKVGSALLTIASAAAIFGGIYSMNDASSSCSSSTGYCSSSNEDAQLSGLMMIGGGVGTLAAVAMSARKQGEVGRETIDRSTTTSIVDSHADCGSDADFDGLRLALILPDGARLVGGVTPSGAVRIPVPGGIELPDEGVEADIVIDDTPEHLAGRVRRGSRLGSVRVARPASSRRASAPSTTGSRTKI